MHLDLLRAIPYYQHSAFGVLPVGEKKGRRKRLLDEHPVCCFCAGENPTETEDHQPGRAFFKERIWPEGFSFPACLRCNEVSKDSENRLSVLIVDRSSQVAREAHAKRSNSLTKNSPDWLPEIVTSTREKRSAAKVMGWLPRPGEAFAELNVARLPMDKWLPDLQMLGRKLMLALHYRLFGKPLPREGYVRVEILTLANNLDYLARLAPAVPISLKMERSGKNLNDQLDIRIGIDKWHNIGRYQVLLQRYAVFAGFSAPSIDVIDDDAKENLYSPFEWR